MELLHTIQNENLMHYAYVKDEMLVFSKFVIYFKICCKTFLDTERIHVKTRHLDFEEPIDPDKKKAIASYCSSSNAI